MHWVTKLVLISFFPSPCLWRDGTDLSFTHFYSFLIPVRKPTIFGYPTMFYLTSEVATRWRLCGYTRQPSQPVGDCCSVTATSCISRYSGSVHVPNKNLDQKSPLIAPGQTVLIIMSHVIAQKCQPQCKESISLFSKSVLRDDDEEDGEKAAQRQNNKSMLSYFSASAGGNNQNPTRQIHRFFTDRRLKSLDTLWKQHSQGHAPL